MHSTNTISLYRQSKKKMILYMIFSIFFKIVHIALVLGRYVNSFFWSDQEFSRTSFTCLKKCVHVRAFFLTELLATAVYDCRPLNANFGPMVHSHYKRN